ncbi:MAG: DNA polymerase III subunit gamma/tau [Lentisphaeria bacterium]|nr:DNA polymerase III subunit gamma/tau [Lentisphaeria bacterium]
MSSEYQVIARKWRPQTFRDVVGQQHVVRTLRNAISSGRTAHAYLFVGPRGIGKTTLARIFAKALNCEHPVDGNPCCECESCRSIAAERSLAVFEVDAASHNSTADMRELADNALTSPVGGKYKIYIIDEVHMLSKAAWNVLLKTVEEPPAHVKFIFATTEVHQVLPTIISRCQRFDLLPIPTRLIIERLRLIADTEKVNIDDDAISAVARAAEGGMRDAQSLLDQMIAFFAGGDGSAVTGEQVLSLFGLTGRRELDAILEAMLGNKPGSVVARVGALAKKGKNLETLFDDILSALRAVNLCTILKNPEELLDDGAEAVENYRRLAKLAPADTVQILLETISPVGRVLHDALNKQVFLETILLKAMREAHAVRLNDILARLNQLRSAGELQFLDKLPVVEGKVAPAAVAETVEIVEESAAVESVVPQVVTEESVPAAAVIETPVVEAPIVEAPVEAVAETPVIEAPVEAVAETPVVEAPVEAVAETPVIEAPVETSVVGTPVIEAPVEAVVETPVVETPVEAESSDDSDNIEEIDANIVAELPMEVIAATEDKKSSDIGGSGRRSVANDEPQALREAVNNPVVHEVVDLFAGTVIDVHR